MTVASRGVTRLWRALSNRMPGSTHRRRQAWLSDKWNVHIEQQREYMFMSIARFCHINRPTRGYYLEFGCHGANTMRMAWDAFRWLFDFDYVAFDSFEGLPEIGAVDRQEIWQKGGLATAEEDFIRLCTAHGIPRERLRTVRGFYDKSLTRELVDQLAPSKAAVVYVDCDLYESTIPVLEFARHFLQPGTVIVFDDWNCFLADPGRGERRAFYEFGERYRDLRFEEFVSTDMQKSFVFTGPR